jgi:tetratricopeptide (TPR) repeat protein
MKTTGTEKVGALIAQRYRVEQIVGRGGMAVVYRVLDARSQRHVALKRCFARDPAQLSRLGLRLEHEYHTLAQLAHPHIIEVYDYGVDGEVPYYTMELLAGGDLTSTERLPWEKTCLVMHDVASALAMLHSRGLLHRDVSVRNVQWTSDGRAKLIDFGTMMSMGVARDVVGTPPFMAPEVMQLQALDGRADLFALGALSYRLLTGRHAFPARHFTELRDVWRSRPATPASLVSDVPAELSNLVMRALTLDRGGRMSTAAEIMEQLRAIAPSVREDGAEISRAYLTSPTLVGREATLLAIRRHILSLVRGDGGLLTIRGVPGSGRSRMLDACALEGKLLGLAVIRADARDAANGEWGVARAIGEQLLAQFPKLAEEAARLSRNVLGQVFSELRSDDDAGMVTSSLPERSLILRELRDWLLAITKTQRMLVLVDDVERADDASLALLTAIAHKAERHALLLILTAVNDPARPLPTALQMLATSNNNLELGELSAPQTEKLVRSVFGDAANVQLCAARIHGLSHGNPRTTLELAQHLVDTRRARYEAGSWVLPDVLDEGDLPSSLSASLLARLTALSPCARELADALALADEDALSMQSFPALTGQRDAKQVFRAVDELVAARIMVGDGTRCAFAQRGFISVLQENMDAERRETLHTRIASLLASTDDVFRRAHHLLAAHLDRDALELLGRLDLSSQIPPAQLLVTAIERVEALDMPARVLHRLRMSLLISAPYAMQQSSFGRVLPIVLAQLELDSGLSRYLTLGHLPPNERLMQAMTQAQQAYQQTPEHERVHTVIDAIRELARMSGAITSMALPAFDLALLESMPDLAPLFPLAPSLAVVGQFVEASKAWMRGRYLRARELMLGVLARLAEPDRAGFDDAQHERMRLGMHWMLGLWEAGYGVASAEQHAKELERSRELRVNAWRVRALLQLAIGDMDEANKCLRRSELLQLQEGLRERYVSATTGMELLMRSRLGDLLGVKSQLPRLARLAEQYPGWRPVELLGRCRYSELQGDLQGALELCERGLREALPAAHPFFAALAASQVSLLSQLGREPEAVMLGRHYLKLCDEQELSPLELSIAVAEVLARMGEHVEAAQALEPRLRDVEQFGCGGFTAGKAYEMRARIALAARDRAAFEHHIECCAREYEKAHNPALASRVEALLEQAREHDVTLPRAAQILGSLRPQPQANEVDTLHSRIQECVDKSDRGRCALTLLLQNAASSMGYLYALQHDRKLELIAALPDAPLDSGIVGWVHAQAEHWLREADRTQTQHELETLTEHETQSQTGELTESVTATGGLADNEDPMQRYHDVDGHALETLMLVDGEVLAAVLVVECIHRQRVYVKPRISAVIARELLAHGDAMGWRAQA